MSSQPDTNRDRLKRIYDNYRNVEMSRDYYACRLKRFKDYNRAYEIIIAIGSSTTVAGWLIWQTEIGKVSWAIFAGIVAVLTIIKPILQLPKEIERYSKLHTGYCDLYYDYRHIVDEVKAGGGITKKLSESTAKAENRYRELALQDDEKPSMRLLRKCQTAVKQRVDSFDKWWPSQLKS